MKRLVVAFGGAGLAILALVATVAAASPAPSASPNPVREQGSSGAIPSVLGLTQAEIMALRHDGLSLAQIADRQKVDPQKLVDALAARWTERIDARVQAGALTTDEATQLKAQVELRAKDMVQKVTLGGMQGVAVGAGPGSGAGNGAGAGPRGSGTGTGTCDGTGPHGAGRP